jgi:hypothetical protein
MLRFIVPVIWLSRRGAEQQSRSMLSKIKREWLEGLVKLRVHHSLFPPGNSDQRSLDKLASNFVSLRDVRLI